MPPIYILSLGLLLLHTTPWCSSSAAANNDTLTAGQVLAVGGNLVSRNGKFALGFFQFQPASTISKSFHNVTSPSLWYLGIWFSKIPVFTTVWVANRDHPITDPNLNLTQLKISIDGNLVIVNHAANTESIVWSTHIVNNRTQANGLNSTSAAILLNTGNLALTMTESPSSSDLLLWQSFDYPTDVMLPGAKFGRNKITSFNRQAISKKSLIDPGLGSYSIELEATRGIVLKRRNPLVEYWIYASSTTSSLNLLPILKSLLDLDPWTKGLLNIAYVDNNKEEYYMYTSQDESSSSIFVSLDISGRTKLNVWSQANQSWQTIYAQPDNPCTPPAACGPFTVCRRNPHSSCDCMESFSQKSPQDWEFEDRTGGCIRNTPLHCTSDKNITSSTDKFHPIAQVTLPYNPQSVVATTQSKCEEACLSSCSCTAYSYNNSMCSIWNGELLSVNLNDGIDITSKDVLYLRLAAKDFLPSLRKNKRKPNVGVVTAASIISFGLLMLMMLLLIWRNKFKWCGLPINDDNQGSASGIIAFRYTDLVRATKNFSKKLGGGGFGSVYKGVLSDLKTTIAVKRLDGAHQGEKQFRAEVSSIGLVQHISLVKLIGFCCEGDHRLLVYEHMLNGSLDGHLFNKSNNVDAAILSWNTRYQITLGVARGLSYLHQSCRDCIIHCDIKPENILVGAPFVPKVADFGLAAFVGRDFS